MNSKISTILFILILLSALGLRGYGAFVRGNDNQQLLHNDGEDYRDIAQNLASGNGYAISTWRWFEPVPDNAENALHEDFYRPPLVPLLGAGLFLTGGDWFLLARITQILISTIICLLVYLCAKQLSGPTTALIALALSAVYIPAIHHTGFWSTENLFTLLLLVALLCILKILKSPPPTNR